MVLGLGRRGLFGLKNGYTRSPSRIGSWASGSGPASATTSKSGIPHESIVCDTVVNGQASQSVTVLTTKANCHEVDSAVTEVGVLANSLSKSGEKKTQLCSWKDNAPKITVDDMVKFKERCSSTPEEDANFQKAKMLAGTPIFQKTAAITNRYTLMANVNSDHQDKFKE